jgi:hypothetical protein
MPTKRLLRVLVVSSVIGLFFFRRWARPLYLVTTILATLLLPVSGPYVASGWSQMIDELGLIVSGVILALIYWSPLKELFKRPTSLPIQSS